MILFLCVAAWLIIGAFGFVYWWTNDYDMTTDDIVLIVGAAIIGPVAWLIGYLIHGVGKGDGSGIIMKRHKR